MGARADVDQRSLYMGLRTFATVVLTTSVAGLVWLPHVPSIIAAVAAALLASVLIIGWMEGQDGLSLGSAGALMVMFTVLRLLALWNEPAELGGVDAVASLLVSLTVFLCFATPRWDVDLARWAMGSLVLETSAAALIFWWLSRAYSSLLGSSALGVEFVAEGLNRNDFGFVVAMAAVMAFTLMHLYQRHPMERFFWFVVCGFDLAFLVALGSRTSLALGMLGVVADLIIERPWFAWWVAGLSIALAFSLPQGLNWIASRGHGVPETISRGAALVQAAIAGDASQIAIASAGRTAIWQAGLAAFAQSPIWGAGPGGLRSSVLGNTGLYTYAHSTLIMLLAESGLVGAILFYAPFLVVLVQVGRSARRCAGIERHIAAGLLSYIIAILLLSPFATTGLDKVSMLLLGLGASLGAKSGRHQNLQHTICKQSNAVAGTQIAPGHGECSWGQE